MADGQGQEQGSGTGQLAYNLLSHALHILSSHLFHPQGMTQPVGEANVQMAHLPLLHMWMLHKVLHSWTWI